MLARTSAAAVVATVFIVVVVACSSNGALVETSDSVTVPAADIADGAHVVFFGDSWTAGYAASTGHDFVDDMAHDMRWMASNDGLSATGYLDPGNWSQDDSYPARAARLTRDDTVRLVIVQGSVNDVEPFTRNPGRYAGAVTATWAALKRAYPHAALFVVGPICPTASEPAAYRQMDATLGRLARARSIAYQSGLSWINSSNRSRVVDAQKLSHPNTAGHRLLASDIESALESRSA